MQSQVKLMRMNFKFEAPILQVQIITNITYSNLIRPNRNVWGFYTFSQYVTQDKLIAKWSVAYQYWKSVSIERVIYIYIYIYTVGTPYNTNVGVQKIPDHAIWKPMVAMTYTPNFSDTWLRPVPHVKTAYIPRLAWANCSPRAFITDCLTTL